MQENQTPPTASTSPSTSNMQPGLIVAAVGLVIAVGAIAYTTVLKKPGTQGAGSYKDGSYTMVGQYVSPGGDEEIGVTVTLKDNVITEAEVKPMATRPNSVTFQGIFAENYKPFVIGKNINDVKLDKVSGSSLSPKGFNDAIEKIKAEARV